MLRWEDCVKRDVRKTGGDEGGQCWNGRTVRREERMRGGRLEEEDKIQRRVEKTIR